MLNKAVDQFYKKYCHYSIITNYRQKYITPADAQFTSRALITALNQGLTNKERQFLLSFKQGEPVWDLLGIDGVENLPAIQWKLMNIKKMTKEENEELTGKLKRKLGL